MKPSLFLLPFLFLTPFVVDSILSDEDEMDAHDRGAHTYRFDLNREPYEHYHDFGSNQAETSNASHNRRRHHYNRSRNDRHDRYRDSDTETSDTDEESGSRRIHLGHDGYEPFHAYNPQQHHHEFGSNHAESSNASLSRSRNNRYNRSQNRTNESAYNYNRRRMLSFNRRMAYDREYIQNLHLNYNRNLSLYSPQQQQINSDNLFAQNEEEYQAMSLQAQEKSIRDAHHNHHRSSQHNQGQGAGSNPGEQANCLAEFLFENYGEEYVTGHEIPKDKIINHLNRIKYGDKYYVYRWDSKKTGKEERAFLKKGFPSKKEDFEKRNECLQIKIFEDESFDSNEDHFEKFYKLYKSFNPKQLFFKYIPIFEGGFYYNPKETKKNKNKDNKAKQMCVICQEELKINDYVYQCSECKQIYHDKCLAKWLTEKGTCPNCRGEIKLTPKLTDDRHGTDKLFSKMWSKGGSKKKT